MDTSPFSSPIWYHALTLLERIKALEQDEADLNSEPLINKTSSLHLQHWRSQPQFTIDTTFNLRLANDGIDLERLSSILGEPVEVLQRLSPDPAWLTWLSEAFNYPPSAYSSPPPGAEELYFLDLIQPLIDQACEQLFTGIDELLDKWPKAPFEPHSIADILLMNLVDPLLMRLGRTMVLELNVARLLDHLDGATAADRFESFIERIRQPDLAVSILAEYPVLARQIVICLNQWVDVSLEFLDRLAQDWSMIVADLCHGVDPGPLVELTGGAGDRHRNGRSVMIAQFESGLQLVYKPKSLAVDIHFQELLTWLNNIGYDPALRTLYMIDRGEYGWVEYVSPQACQTEAEVERFYGRLGAYLALLYAINASDFHLENLIACGENPVLIDLETLFNPEFERFEENDAATAAEKGMLNSVLVVGMLPQRLWSQNAYKGIDISGLGGESGQLSPDRIPQPAAPGTDEMRYIRKRLELSGEANRPMLGDNEISAINYKSQLIAGFRSMYLLLLDNRVELLADAGPITRFALDETRVLLRPTRTYDQLLFESFHPDVLRDALQRDLLLDRLWVVVPERSFMAEAISAEQHDLRHGDIPVFTTDPASLTLLSASGDPINGILQKSGLAIAKQRIRHLDKTSLRRQEWFINSSIATLTPYEFGLHSPSQPRYQLLPPKGDFNRQRSLDHAYNAASELATAALLGQNDVTWIGLEHLGEGIWDLAPVGMDFYNGLPGIALFLSYAGILLQEDEFTTLAQRAVNSMLRHIEQFSSELPGIGAFEGWGGLLFTLTHLAQLWDDDSLLSQAEAIVAIIANFIDEDEKYAVMDGAAGAIASLLAFQTIKPSTYTLETAIACGDHLLGAALEMENGLGWVIPRFGPHPQLGFAHGAAGISWSLLRLMEASGCDRFGITAQQGFSYERSFFSDSEHNWPDLRQYDVENGIERYHTAWCHGACGIGLTRLGAISLQEDPQYFGEISAALQTTINRGFGQSHCLCHGDVGNLDLLLEAYQLAEHRITKEQLRRSGAMILDSIDRDGWQCGGPGAVDLPGLMIGISGIGYQLLRLAEPEKVPSVLLLAPPFI